MRPIVSWINSLIERISKFLITKFKCSKPPPTCSIKIFFEFVNKLQNVIIDEDEVMASFDVSFLFPGLPRAEYLDLIINWIHGLGSTKDRVSDFHPKGFQYHHEHTVQMHFIAINPLDAYSNKITTTIYDLEEVDLANVGMVSTYNKNNVHICIYN